MTHDILLLSTPQVTIVHGDSFKKLSEDYDVFSGDTVKRFFFWLLTKLLEGAAWISGGTVFLGEWSRRVAA